MKTPDDTRRLIADLGKDIADGRGARPLAFEPALWRASALALTLAVGLALWLAGGVGPIASKFTQPWFYHKIICLGALAGGASLMLQDLASPRWRQVSALPLMPAFAILLLGALADRSGLALTGRSPVSVPSCVGSILLLSAPGLAIILFCLKRVAATVRPALAGAVAGLLAAGLGGSAYAIACRNDGGLFVIVWYGAAVLVSAGLGAAVGRRLLAW